MFSSYFELCLRLNVISKVLEEIKCLPLSLLQLVFIRFQIEVNLDCQSTYVSSFVSYKDLQVAGQANNSLTLSFIACI